MRLADAMCGDQDSLAGELAATLRQRFDETERAELLVICGEANLNNRLSNAAEKVLGEDPAD